MASPGSALLVLLSLLGAPVQQDTAAAAPDTARPAPADTVGALVVVRGDTLFRIYAPVGAMSMEDRARAVEQRILASGRVHYDSIYALPRAGDVLVMAGSVPLLAVTAEDAAAAGVPADSLAARYIELLRPVLVSVSLRERVRMIAFAILQALAITVVFTLAGWLLLRLFARADAALRLWRERGVLPSIRIQRFELLSVDQIALILGRALVVLRIALLAVLAYFYLVVVLQAFPQTRDTSTRILSYVIEPLTSVGTAIAEYLPNLFFIAVIVLVTRYLLLFIHLVFRAIGSGALSVPGFEPDWSEPTYKLVRVMVLAFSLVVLFPYLPGSGSDAFKGVSIFVGVLFSLGSTGAVANLVAGSLLTYTRSFQVGDVVRIGQTTGKVIARTLLVTRVRTVSNVEVSIPNSAVMSSEVYNYSTMARAHGVIIQTSITIGYDVPWRRVHELLLQAAAATEDVLPDPKPFVLQTGLQDYYPAYELNVYIRNPERLRWILSALNANIQDAFAKGGVEITSPAYTSIRDGNAAAIPPEHLPKDYVAPVFRTKAEG